MSYQTRLDQLESDVFQTAPPSTPLSFTQYLPFLIIAVVSLLTLYTFCPKSLQTRQNRQYRINIQRFGGCWLILTAVLCALYAFYARKSSEMSTA